MQFHIPTDHYAYNNIKSSTYVQIHMVAWLMTYILNCMQQKVSTLEYIFIITTQSPVYWSLLQTDIHTSTVQILTTHLKVRLNYLIYVSTAFCNLSTSDTCL